MPNMNKREKISRSSEAAVNLEKDKAGPQGSKNLQHMGSITLEEALEVFEYPSLLKDLDNSLEMARKGEKTKEQHEQYCNDLDKKLQRRSLQYHSDRIMNKGGTEAEIAAAEETQKVLNAVRTVIKSLNKHFCEDIDVEYRYSFYAKIAVSLLHNDKELEQVSFKILTKLSGLAEIKQEGIIANINAFLKSSQASIENFIANNLDEFRREKDRAICCLGSCVRRYDEFVKELKLIEKDCCKDQELESMRSSIIEMLKEAQDQANTLKKLEEFSMKQSQRKWQPFKLNSEEKVDKYFILPFIEYVNVLLMCSDVQRKEINERSLPLYVTLLDHVGNVIREWIKELFKDSPEREEIHKIEKDDIQEDLYSKSYYLMCYLNEDTKYEEIVADFLKMRKGELNREVVRLAFTETIKMYKDYLVNKFKPECYVESGIRKQMKELSNYMDIIDSLMKRTEQDLIRVDKAAVCAGKVMACTSKAIADTDKIMADTSKAIADIGKIMADNDKIITSVAKKEQQADKAINFLERFVSKKLKKVDIADHGIANQGASTNQQQSADQVGSQLSLIRMGKVIADAGETMTSVTKEEQQADKAINFLEGLIPNAKALTKIEPKKANIARGNFHGASQETSTNQQQPINQADDQPGPSCKLDEVQPVLRDHSLHSGYSGSSNL